VSGCLKSLDALQAVEGQGNKGKGHVGVTWHSSLEVKFLSHSFCLLSICGHLQTSMIRGHAFFWKSIDPSSSSTAHFKQALTSPKAHLLHWTGPFQYYEFHCLCTTALTFFLVFWGRGALEGADLKAPLLYPTAV